MKNLFFLFTLLSFISCNNIPKELVIHMENKVKDSPFNKTVIPARPNKTDTIKMDGVMQDLERIEIRTINFQKSQAGKIKQDVHFFVGEKNDKIFIKVDANNNGTFVDDNILEFKKDLTPAELELIKDSLPVVSVDYEYLLNNKILNLKSTLMVTPYIKSGLSLKVGNKWIDPFENEFEISFLELDYKKAEVKVNGKKYQIAVNGYRNQYKTMKQHTELIMIGSDELFTPTWLGYVPVRLGEEFIVDNFKYEFKDISELGDTIKLVFKGMTSGRLTGVNVGQFASDFQKNTVDNKLFKLSGYKGNYILIDFWGTWCKPCVASLPKLKSIYSQCAEKGLVMLSVAYDDDLEKVKNGIKEHSLIWNNIYQNSKDTSQIALTKLFQVKGYPTLILIAPDGKIIARYQGNNHKTDAELKNILNKIYHVSL